MKVFFGFLLLALALSCCVPTRALIGSYVNGRGDSLVLNANFSFRVEMKEPDSSRQAFKFTTGRWARQRNKVYLTPAVRNMGDYWQCLPLKARPHVLKRADDCDKSGPTLVFKKTSQKKMDHKFKKAERKEREEEEARR